MTSFLRKISWYNIFIVCFIACNYYSQLSALIWSYRRYSILWFCTMKYTKTSTFRIMTLCIMILSLRTPSKVIYNLTQFSLRTFSITTLSRITHIIMTPSILTLSITKKVVSIIWFGDSHNLATILMEQRTLRNVNHYLNTNIYSYLMTSGGQSSILYLNVVHF